MHTSTREAFSAYWSNCPDAACVLDAMGRIIGANPRFFDTIGDLIGEMFVDHAASQNRLDVQAHLDLLREGKPVVSFFSLTNEARADARLLAWRVWRAGDSDATFIAVAMSAKIDAGGQAHLEEILRSYEIIDTSPMFVVAIDASGKTVFMNSTMLERFRYTRDDVLGKDYARKFVPEREHAALGDIFRKLSSTDKATLSENHVLTRDGEERLVQWHGRPIFDKDEHLQYFYGLGMDVTDQRRTQDDLLRSQQRFELHFRQSPLGMIEWDRDFRVTDWNPAAERIFGYTRAEALGQYGQDLVVPESVRPYVANVWQQLLDSRGAVNAYNDNVTKDGRTIVCEWSNTTLVNSNGEVIGVASLVNDVTDRKKAEESLRERERIQSETIQQLSVPLIDVWDGIIALPIVGAIDETRAVLMTEALLETIVTNGTRCAILDLTGAGTMDDAIANRLGDMIRAVRLVGSECLISGLSPQVARILVELNLQLSVRTFGTLRAALSHAIGRYAHESITNPLRGRGQIISGHR